MTSNGSESLHMVFREARGLPICALVIQTYYKLLEWFNKRRMLARELWQNNQTYSNRVSRILERRAEKAMRHEVRLVDIDAGVYEVIAKNERQTSRGRQDRSYEVIVNTGIQYEPVKCKCRKPLNTGIACSHVLAVCAARNYDSYDFTHPYYLVNTLVATWEGQFKVFGREEDWPQYDGETIIPDRNLIKKGRRKANRYKMTMDILEGRVGPRFCEVCGTIDHTTREHPHPSQQEGLYFFLTFLATYIYMIKAISRSNLYRLIQELVVERVCTFRRRVEKTHLVVEGVSLVRLVVKPVRLLVKLVRRQVKVDNPLLAELEVCSIAFEGEIKCHVKHFFLF